MVKYNYSIIMPSHSKVSNLAQKMSFQTCSETLRAQREATVATGMDFHVLVETKKKK